uniref:F-box associated domain-containing protein n=1 Tax=Arundo donax TaxID=35708 RepID=A0A0A9GL29_ARUDO
MLNDRTRSVFLNGFMHSLTFSDAIVAVDMEGKKWRTIPTPSVDDFGCIDQVQGRLCLLKVDSDDATKLSFWILEDYGTHE